MRAAIAWGAVAILCAAPLVGAAYSPLLAWREPVYVAAGFAGILALAMLVTQPLLARAARGFGLTIPRARKLHRIGGVFLVCAVLVHVVALWITSPPDVIDVFLFRSPTPFSVWGVLAMWALLLAAILAVLRRKLWWRPRTWRGVHLGLVSAVVTGSVAHTLLIEGTMEPITKVILCIAVATTGLYALVSAGAAVRSRSPG